MWYNISNNWLIIQSLNHWPLSTIRLLRITNYRKICFFRLWGDNVGMTITRCNLTSLGNDLMTFLSDMWPMQEFYTLSMCQEIPNKDCMVCCLLYALCTFSILLNSASTAKQPMYCLAHTTEVQFTQEEARCSPSKEPKSKVQTRAGGLQALHYEVNSEVCWFQTGGRCHSMLFVFFRFFDFNCGNGGFFAHTHVVNDIDDVDDKWKMIDVQFLLLLIFSEANQSITRFPDFKLPVDRIDCDIWPDHKIRGRDIDRISIVLD